jgi:hypothetical protein
MEYTSSDALSDAQLASENLFDSINVWSNAIDNLSIMKAPLQSKLSGYIHQVRYLEAAASVLGAEVEKIDQQAILGAGPDDESSLEDSFGDDMTLETMLLSDDVGGGGFPRTVNLTRLREQELAGGSAGRLSGIRSMSEGVMLKQLQKDVERDTVEANGVKVVGANVGLQGLQDQLSHDAEALLVECRLPPASIELRTLLHTTALQHVTRSNSGVVAFQLLQALTADPDTVLLPVSEKQYPLRLATRVGGFRAPDMEGGNDGGRRRPRWRSRWGLVMEAETGYLFRVLVTPQPPLPPPARSVSDEARGDNDETIRGGDCISEEGGAETEEKSADSREGGDLDPETHHVLLTYSTAICAEADPRQRLLELEPGAEEQGHSVRAGERKSRYRNVHFCDEYVKLERVLYPPRV